MLMFIAIVLFIVSGTFLILGLFLEEKSIDASIWVGDTKYKYDGKDIIENVSYEVAIEDETH